MHLCGPGINFFPKQALPKGILTVSQSNRWLRPGLVGPGFLGEPSPPPGSLFLHGLVPGLKAQNPVLVVKKMFWALFIVKKLPLALLVVKKVPSACLVVNNNVFKHAKQSIAMQSKTICKAMQSNAKQYSEHSFKKYLETS